MLFPEIYDINEIIKPIVSWGKFSTALWDKLIKREIYEKVEFPLCSYIEDRVITIQTAYYSTNIGYIQESFYHYMYNPNSISNNKETQIKNIIDKYYNYALIVKFLKKINILENIEPDLSLQINLLKLEFLLKKELRSYFYKIMNDLYPESVKKLFNKNNNINIFYKIFLLSAQYIRNQSLLFKIVDIYNFILNIIKILYRKITPKKSETQYGIKHMSTTD